MSEPAWFQFLQRCLHRLLNFLEPDLDPHQETAAAQPEELAEELPESPVVVVSPVEAMTREEALHRWKKLTMREREIARLMGGSGDLKTPDYKELGEQLCLSPRTVGNHLNHVYRKLGVRGRQDLMDFLHKLDG